MPASFKSSNADLATALGQIGGYITKAVNDRMQQAMEEVQRVAKERAPLEHGNLRAAIKIDKSAQRRSWAVFVDETMPDDTGRYTVGDYALWLHESIDYTPKTPGTGRKYLEDPFREIVNDNLLAELRRLLDSEIAKRSRR